MYNKILTVIAIAIGTIGSVIAVLSVIKMNEKSIMSTKTALQHDTSELSTLREVYEAKAGTGLVVLAAIVQGALEFVHITSSMFFGVAVTVIIGFAFLVGIIAIILHRKKKKKMIDAMEPQIKVAYEESQK